MTREERIRYLKGLLKCELCEEESTKICKSCDNRRIGSSAKCYDALKEVIKELEQEPKIKVLDRDEVIRKLAAVDIYQARAWITLLNDLEHLELKICEVEE